MRLNANGKRLDAWLVYNCLDCKNSWNRPVLERRQVRDIDPSLLNALTTNDPDYVRRLAFDVEDLQRRVERIAEFPEVEVRKAALNAPTSPPDKLELRLIAPLAIGLRLDRLLASELRISRSRLEALASSALLRLPTAGVRALRRPVKDQTIVEIELSEIDGEIDVGAAVG